MQAGREIWIAKFFEKCYHYYENFYSKIYDKKFIIRKL